jgi:hypothetical protein
LSSASFADAEDTFGAAAVVVVGRVVVVVGTVVVVVGSVVVVVVGGSVEGERCDRAAEKNKNVHRQEQMSEIFKLVSPVGGQLIANVLN